MGLLQFANEPPERKTALRWKHVSVLMAISVIWPACCFAQNQPARPAANAQAKQSQSSPAYATSIRAFGNVPPAKSAAQGANPNGAEAQVDPQLRADILHLFALMNFRQTEQSMVQQMFRMLGPALVRMLPDTPHREQIAADFIQKMETMSSSGELENRIVLVYAKYFNDSQIRALIQFYESPVGRYEMSIQEPLRRDAGEAGMRVGLEHVPAIEAELCSDYPELRGKAKFCPAAPEGAPAPRQ